MKAIKNYLIILILIAIILLNVVCINKSYAVTPTLEQIVEKFKNSDAVKEYQSEKWGYKINIDYTDDTIKIITDTTNMSGGKVYTDEFKLQDGILSIDLKDGLMGFDVIWGMEMISCVGELHGYTSEYMTAIMNSDKINEYTLENEGIEVSESSIKINIENMNLQENMDEIYITLDDLKDEDIFEKGGSLQLSRGYVTLYLTINDDNVVITIGENANLTERAYKTLCSVLEKIFNESIVNEFKSSYTSFSVGNKEWENFKIEINPEKSNMESVVFSDDLIARVTLDKSSVNENTFKSNSLLSEPNNPTSAIEENNAPITNELQNSDASKLNQNTLPKTGNQSLMIFIIIGIVATIAIAFKFKKYDDIK